MSAGASTMLKIKKPIILDNIRVITENFIEIIENAKSEDNDIENVCVDGVCLSNEDISSVSFSQVQFKNC